MSGDVQPRKRKDKKRKRDSLDRRSDGDFVFTRKQSLQDDEPREQHQGVHGSKMGNEDVHLHVQGDHETGGHWCAKLFFFSLLAILLGLIGLIILENRGLADLDTPLSESRFSNYFDGWVDEHREAHDEHDAVTASIEEHEHGDEPFEEEEDHSEIDEAEDDEEEKDHEDDEEDDEENEEDEEDTKEEDNDNETEEVDAETAEEADDETQEDEENDNESVVEESAEETREEDDDDEEADDKNANDNDNDNEDTNEDDDNKNDDDDEDEEDEDTTEDIEPPPTRTHQSSHQTSSAQSKTKEDDDNDDDDDEPFEEEDDDGTFESLESVVVDNDAQELSILQEKARQQQANSKKEEPEPEEEPSSYTSSLAVKIGVGVALALVARLVLIRKNPNTNEPSPEALMKRRLTIAAPEDTFTEDHDELLEYDVTEEDEAMTLEQSGEEEYIEEEIEEEEEIEVTDEEYEEEKIEDPLKYKPQTFEQLNSMYRRPNEYQPTEPTANETPKKASPPKVISDEPRTSKIQDYNQREEPLPVAATKPSQSRFAHYHREKTPPPAVAPIKLQQVSSANLPHQEKVESTDSRGYSDEHEEDVEYDDEELYEDEMLDEEEEEEVGDDEEDEEDLSDVDDSELMNRLEAKYGRLPAKEFESDEDVEDQTWTKIKPRGGGPQAMDDDEFEEELKKANEEMLRENLNAALTLFESLSRKFPDKPEAFLGQAKILDKQSEIQRSNSKLMEALGAYKRYLAFAEDIPNGKKFSEVAHHCVDRMRFIGLHLQAVPIHEMLIEKFPNEVSHRNQLAVTYLMMNRLSDAKHALEEILARWPNDGFAMVHYGFVLKNLNQNLELAVDYLRKGIDTQSAGTQDGRFFFNLGDSLQRLGRIKEAREIYRRGTALKLFLSEYQRSLYNVDSLRAQPFWSKKETGYEHFLNQIEKNWQVIRDEGLRALNAKGAFQNETENLRDRGDWKQFELFARGQRRSKNCLEAPVTCGIIEMFPSARFCKRGQVKFSVMHPGTHVWPHCGPTNCRLRAHLGLKVPPGTLLRVAKEKRTWQEGKFLIFDDSFEHEVWHNGTSPRLVLIVDIWHPDLTELQRQSLSPI